MAILDGLDPASYAIDLQKTSEKNNIDAQVGDRLRFRRLTMGMTQAQLARHLGLSAQQIHKYEMGASRLTSSRLHQLSQILDVSIAWFFGEGDTDESDFNECFQMLNDQYNLEILKAAHSIQSNKRKARLVKIAQLFAEEE